MKGLAQEVVSRGGIDNPIPVSKFKAENRGVESLMMWIHCAASFAERYQKIEGKFRQDGAVPVAKNFALVETV
jgi:hypothetical protein